VLTQRQVEGANEFWLSHGNQRYPAISLLVKDGLAALHFFRKEYDAGLRSAGNLADLESGATTTFCLTIAGDEVEVLNDAVMPFAVALTVAREFLASNELPQSVEWLEL
jgi:hypothetical protein